MAVDLEKRPEQYLSIHKAVSMGEEKTYTLDEAHLHFAKTLNGKVWDLLQKPERSPSENELMIYAAHASCYHWLSEGTGLHHQRAEWLIAHVYTELGLVDPARRHAFRCIDLTNEYAALMQDFDIAYAYEGAARACALAGETEEARHYLRLTEEAGRAIRDGEDREIFLGDLNSGSWYGLR
jgi:hypothetical protein